MGNKDLIKLPPQILSNIKKMIGKHINDEPKQHGFEELAVYYATGFISQSQARKIKSFYATYTPSEGLNNQQKKKLYDETHILPFVKSSLTHLDNVNKTSINAKKNSGTGSQTGRSVDRLGISKTQASIRPPKTSTNPTKPNPVNEGLKMGVIFDELTINQNTNSLNEELDRFLLNTTYDTSEGLKIKRFRVYYQVGSERIRTTLSLYSASETQAITKLKQTKGTLKNKKITILSIEPLK